jgi:hypothetical protein
MMGEIPMIRRTPQDHERVKLPGKRAPAPPKLKRPPQSARPLPPSQSIFVADTPHIGGFLATLSACGFAVPGKLATIWSASDRSSVRPGPGVVAAWRPSVSLT